jgi:hypothetical protein
MAKFAPGWVTVMDLNRGLEDLVAVALVALAPMVVAVLPGPRIPQVVVFSFGGILIGPHVLGLAETSKSLLENLPAVGQDVSGSSQA